MTGVRLLAAVLALAAGCSREAGPGGGDPDPPAGPGRFAHSAIRSTVGPADGAATLLLLSEAPFDGERPTGPHAWIGMHGFPHQLSGDTVRVEPGDLATGWARWSPAADRSDAADLRAAVIKFGRVADGEPVEGEYDLTLPDGTRARGRFRATWLPREGPGG